MKISSFTTNLPAYLAIVIISTVPIIFGSVHPIVQGTYVAIILIGCGSWFLFSDNLDDNRNISYWWYFPIIIVLCFLVFQSVPLPLSWVEILSPHRADRVIMVNKLAGTDQRWVSISDNGLISLQRAALIVSLFVFFLTLKRLLLRDTSFIYLLVGVLAVVGCLEAIYGLFQFLNPQIGVLWLPIKSRAAHGTIIYKNQFASLLNICWPVVLAAAIAFFQKSYRPSRRKRKRKNIKESISRISRIDKQVPILLLCVLIMIMAVLFSLSRGGIIAMILVLLLFLYMLPVRGKTKIGLTALLLVLVLGYGSLLGIDTIINRFNSIGASGGTRLTLYVESLTMLKEHWLSGIGLGSFTLLSPVYLKGFSETLHNDRVHSEYLELFIELGIPMALFFFGWLVIVMTRTGLILIRQTRAVGTSYDYQLIVAVGAYSGLVGFLVHGAMDFGWRLPANLVYTVVLSAILSHVLDNLESKQENG